eukprot:TRINITY_DN1584_c0_g1_i6.p1 TRINITY_DN1584_c0_g1~~TRINITY_DN1584_c0_g1_i6.p1  ORF type:complete len:399 (+),score=60.73 TRINITY_DN1584_c0_g1_i6:72-1199(+)
MLPKHHLLIISLLLLLIITLWEPGIIKPHKVQGYIPSGTARKLEQQYEHEINSIINGEGLSSVPESMQSAATTSTNGKKTWEDILIPRHKKEKNPPEWRSPLGPVPVQPHWVVKNSTNGIFIYKADGAFRDSILVVLGGNTYDETAELVERGYAVWRMKEPCRDTSSNRKSTNCHEQYGYLGYLSDPTAPRYEIVNFIHGHKYAWHQQYGFKGLEIASQCAQKTGRFEPHVKHEAHYRYKTEKDYDKEHGAKKPYRPMILASNIRMEATTVMWNTFYGSFIRKISTTGRVMHWCCANFAVPRRMIDLHTPSDYKKVFEIMISKHEPIMGLEMSGFWIERIWHLLFGEPQDVEPRAEPWVNCTDESYKPPYFEPVK